MLLPGGPPLPPSFGCRSAVILRVEQTRRHCQRDAATPRAAVPERVPIPATQIYATRIPGAWVGTAEAPLALCRGALACKASDHFRQGCDAHFQNDENPAELEVLRPR